MTDRHKASTSYRLCTLVLWLAGLMLPVSGWAACSTAASAVSLGSINSLSLIGSAPQAAGAGGLNCSGSLTLLTRAYVRATLVSSTFILQGSEGQVPFRVYSDTGYTQAMNVGQTAQYNENSIILIGLGSSTGVALFFKTLTGANVPAGTYTGTVTLNWQWAICSLGVINLCAWDRSPGVVQPCTLGVCGEPTNWGTGSISTVTVTLVVPKACEINNLPTVDFGTQALVGQFSSVTTSVMLRCTQTEGFTIGFDNGQNYQAPWRYLLSGGNRIRYHIYYPGTSTVWSLAQPLTASGTGLLQSFQFQAVIDPTQGNVPAGTYIDNVVMTITY